MSKRDCSRGKGRQSQSTSKHTGERADDSRDNDAPNEVRIQIRELERTLMLLRTVEKSCDVYVEIEKEVNSPAKYRTKAD